MLEFLLVYAWFAVPVISVLCIALGIDLFRKIPLERRWKRVFKWLLTAVLKAERFMESEPGPYKLHLVYTWFREDFPIRSRLMRYNTFCALVSKALKQNADTFKQ